jgi:hypothetical protein
LYSSSFYGFDRLALPYLYLFDEWVNFAMQRKQLLGIKARAEAQAGDNGDGGRAIGRSLGNHN